MPKFKFTEEDLDNLVLAQYGQPLMGRRPRLLNILNKTQPGIPNTPSLGAAQVPEIPVFKPTLPKEKKQLPFVRRG